jgi:hypothetical protein
MGGICSTSKPKKEKEVKIKPNKKLAKNGNQVAIHENVGNINLKYPAEKVILIQKWHTKWLKRKTRKQLEQELNSLILSTGCQFLTLPEFEMRIPTALKDKYTSKHLIIPEDIYNSVKLKEEIFMKFPVLYPNGEVYFGEMTSKGLFQGYGVLLKQNKHMYEGLWNSGQLVYGREYYINGTIYEGKFKNNQPYDETGVFYYSDGDRYFGSVKDTKRDGPGELIFNDSTLFKGEFKNDLFHGKGSIEWPDNNTYEGEFNNGVIEGYGKLTTAEGNVYQGDWKDNLKDGKGIFIWACGYSYTGHYVKGKKEGRGIYVAKRVKYDGEWKNDKPHGQGTYTEDDRVIEGVFRYGKLESINGKEVSDMSVTVNIERENMVDVRSLPHIAVAKDYTDNLYSDEEAGDVSANRYAEVQPDNIAITFPKSAIKEKHYLGEGQYVITNNGYEKDQESFEANSNNEFKLSTQKIESQNYREIIEKVNKFNDQIVKNNNNAIITTKGTEINDDNNFVITENSEIIGSDRIKTANSNVDKIVNMANPFEPLPHAYLSTPEAQGRSLNRNYVQRLKH